jgi:hypothetical protein
MIKARIKAYTKPYFEWLGLTTIVELEPFGKCMVLKEEYDLIARRGGKE